MAIMSTRIDDMPGSAGSVLVATLVKKLALSPPMRNKFCRIRKWAVLVFACSLAPMLSQCYIARFDAQDPAVSATLYATLEALLSACVNPGKIAFTSNSTGNYDIFLMDEDGSSPVQLTFDGGTDHHADFSPDGRLIVFESDRTGVQGLYLIDTNGENERPLLVDSNPNINPVFSNDGRGIYFASPRLGGIYSIFHLEIESGLLTQVTSPGAGASDLEPAVAANSPYLFFTRTVAGADAIARAFPDGSSPQIIVNDGTAVNSADLAPDGSFFVYTSDGTGDNEVYRAAIDGSGSVNISQATAQIDTGATISPDSTEILFESTRLTGSQEIFRMNGDGSNPVPLTSDGATNTAPSWSCR